jgi:alkylation response protein AidB-like acyl-CoA dehydrogenase
VTAASSASIPNDPATIMRLLGEATPRNPAPGFLKSAVTGAFRWDLVQPFPVQDRDDEIAGDLLIQRQADFLLTHINPTEIDAGLPPDFVKLFRQAGWQKLLLPKELGGDGVSPLNMARLAELTGSWCPLVAMCISVSNYLGVPSYLPHMRDPAARLELAGRVVAGAISGLAAVEPQGASNPIFQTTAIPSADGSHFVINGTKCYIRNGALADLLVVPCTTFSQGTHGDVGISVFILDTNQPGFRIASTQSYMGFNGCDDATLEFTDCIVPASHLVGELGKGLNVVMALQQPNRMFINAVSLAVSKLCLTWLRGFSDRLYMEQPLSGYQATQATIADAAAKVFAQEAVMRWTTLTQMAGDRDLWNEWTAMKPWSSDSMWSVIDGTMSLLAGRGYETAVSLARRGMEPYPVERFYRDARVLRIFGTTNSLMEVNLGFSAVMAAATGPSPASTLVPPTRVLSPANRAHLEAASVLTTQISVAAHALIERSGGVVQAMAQQPALTEIGRALSLLWAQAVTLARVESEAGGADDQGAQMQMLADIFCRDAAFRATSALAKAADWQSEPAASVSAQVMAGTMEWLVDGIIAKVPPA